MNLHTVIIEYLLTLSLQEHSCKLQLLSTGLRPGGQLTYNIPLFYAHLLGHATKRSSTAVLYVPAVPRYFLRLSTRLRFTQHTHRKCDWYCGAHQCLQKLQQLQCCYWQGELTATKSDLSSILQRL